MKTFREELRTSVRGMWGLDAHEHLHLPEEHGQKALDCFYLTNHYLKDDLVSAGMAPAEMESLVDRSLPLEERWRRFAPWWEFARTTGYGHAVEVCVRELFGLPGLSGETYTQLSEMVASHAGKLEWYEHVLKEKSRFISCLADVWRWDISAEMHRYFLLIMRFDEWIMARTRQELTSRKECAECGEPGSLGDYLRCLDEALQHYLRVGVVGLKCGLAYRRSLRFEVVDRSEAERLFERGLRDDLPGSEAVPLQDFLFHEVCDRAAALGLPYQIHTGLQAGTRRANIQQTNPALLSDTLQAHPSTKFDLFHGGYPYGGELATLAKNFPNAHINACWLAIIAPTVLRRQLHEWLDTVPHNKIQAFGGDYFMPELAYAHSLMAKEAVADVLTERVEAGYLTEEDAPVLARRLLAENGIALFKLSAEKVAAATVLGSAA
jgi:uncharacterized protein